MNYNFLGAASAALMIVIVFTLVLAPAAGAAGKSKVLYRFHGGSSAESTGPMPASILGIQPAMFYGTTLDGGASTYGTVFKLAPNQRIEAGRRACCTRSTAATELRPYSQPHLRCGRKISTAQPHGGSTF